jgi:hypothetical protein
MLNQTHDRRATTTPPLDPPPLTCPVCDLALKYVSSHIGGVSIKHPEQWDDFECVACGRTFQYRQRTRKLRQVS